MPGIDTVGGSQGSTGNHVKWRLVLATGSLPDALAEVTNKAGWSISCFLPDLNIKAEEFALVVEGCTRGLALRVGVCIEQF